MLLEVDSNIDISSHCSGVLVTLSVENVVVGIRYTLLNSYLYYFLSLFYALALASFAAVYLIDYHSRSAAIIARSLNLGIHSWAKLGHFHGNTRTLAVWAFLWINSTFAFAICTNSHS